jgi:hypothetical protein
MAVYRSDQAQLTFGTEAAPGGYPDLASTVVLDGTGGGTAANGTIAFGSGYAAGVRSIAVTTSAGTFAVGDVIAIGPGVSGNGTAAESEVRKIEHVEGTSLYLDAPTAFFHPNNTDVDRIKSITATAADMHVNLVPGVYETVDVPDPDMTIEARYFLGTASKRNFYAAYKGQQTYTGSVPGFILLNGKPLRFPIGKVVSLPSASTTFTNATTLAPGSGLATKVGDVFVPIAAPTAIGIAVNELIVFDYTASPDSTSKMEVRKYVGAAITAGTTTTIQLDYPLQFPHDHGVVLRKVTQVTGTYYTHHIFETVDLATVSWHLHMKDSGETLANDLDRRYYGGKIGGATLSADEGGMLNMSWDGVNFQGMVHNQKLGQSSGSGVTVPFYGMLQSIQSTNVQFPTTEPYYFSQGSVKIFGQEIARVRNFSLSIANNEEPRYYIQRRYGRQRGPSEIREQRREYSFSCTLALPDSGAAETDSTARLFNELLWEGDYGASSGTGMQGFDIELRFDRGVNDYIIIRIPDDYTGVAGTGAQIGGNNQGAFIRTAPHAVTGDNPLQVDADVLFRNLKIEVKDSEYYYP